MSGKAQSKPSAREMELDDMLTDVMIGFDAWSEAKVAGGHFDAFDEMFMRWIEAGPVRANYER